MTIPILDNGLTEPAKKLSLELISASGGAYLGDQFSVTINIPSRPHLQSAQLLPPGKFSFVLTGAEMTDVRIEASPEMAQWHPLETITDRTRPFVWTDQRTSPSDNQFYRAVAIR